MTTQELKTPKENPYAHLVPESLKRNPPTKVSSLSEGLGLMQDWLTNHEFVMPGTAWCILVDTPEGLIFYPRDKQPCYGEMRPYDGQEYRPRDLKDPFPDGSPVRLGVRLTSSGKKLVPLYLSGKNPWNEALKGAEIIYKDSKPCALIIHDLNVNSDILVHFLLCMRGFNHLPIIKLVKLGLELDTATLLANSLVLTDDKFSKPYYTKLHMLGYHFFGATLQRWYKRQPNVPKRHLFSERAPYRRSEIEGIWLDKYYDEKFDIFSLESLKTGRQFSEDQIIAAAQELETKRKDLTND